MWCELNTTANSIIQINFHSVTTKFQYQEATMLQAQMIPLSYHMSMDGGHDMLSRWRIFETSRHDARCFKLAKNNLKSIFKQEKYPKK
jgi:hypothetical protein